MKISIAAIFNAYILLSTSLFAEERMWTRSDGREINAELLQVGEEHVHLRIDRKIDVKMPKARLIDADWEWAMETAKKDPSLLQDSPKLVTRTWNNERTSESWRGRLFEIRENGRISILAEEKDKPIEDWGGKPKTLVVDQLSQEDREFIERASMTPEERKEQLVQRKREAGKDRSWTSTDGRTIIADFVRFEGENVVVLLRGNEVPISFSRLSEADRKWVRSDSVPARKPDPAPNPAPAVVDSPLGNTDQKPELLVDEGSSGSVSIKISIPASYHVDRLAILAPDGFTEEVHHLDASKLDPYLSALTDLEKYVGDLSNREAQQNEAKIRELSKVVDAASREAGIGVLASYTAGGASGRAAASAFGTVRDTRSRDEKRADPLVGQVRVDSNITQDDSKRWRETKSAIRECLHLFSHLTADTRFIYPGETVNPGVDAHDKRWGTWILEADGKEIDRAEVKRSE